MRYSPHKLRIWINNAESSLRYFAQKRPQNMTPFDHKAIELNMRKIAKYQKMLDSSKQFVPKYL